MNSIDIQGIFNSVNNFIQNILNYVVNLNLDTVKGVFINFVIFVVIVILIIFVVGFTLDFINKNNYNVKKNPYRTLADTIGGGEEYYYKYWLWQPNKKKYLIDKLMYDLEIPRVYARKALKKKKNEKTIIPFRREVYGKAK